MPITLSKETIHNFVAATGFKGIVLTEEILALSHYKTAMTDDEKMAIDEEIARRQFEEDPNAKTTDSAIVMDVLRDNGFHPAFEYGGEISGQAAFERLRDTSSGPTL